MDPQFSEIAFLYAHFTFSANPFPTTEIFKIHTKLPGGLNDRSSFFDITSYARRLKNDFYFFHQTSLCSNIPPNFFADITRAYHISASLPLGPSYFLEVQRGKCHTPARWH